MKKAAMTAFGRLPPVVRRQLVRAGTPSYTVGVVVVLRNDTGEVLLVDQRHTGAWGLPGGLLKHGEDPVAGIVREVAEEVGVELDPSALPMARAVVAPRARRVDLVFRMSIPAGATARAADPAEVKRIGWFLPDELPRMTEPTADVLRAVLAD